MKGAIRRAILRVGRTRNEEREAGLREVHPDDVFVVSYPKSGNTWVRFLIASMLHPHAEVSFRNIERFVPDLHKSRRAIDAMPPPRIVKSHAPCFDAYPRLVYVLRDGRDAMVSYRHYVLGKGSFAGSLAEFVKSREARRYGTWSGHVLGALEFARRHPERVLFVRYEDLHADPLDQARRIAAFCRLYADAETVEGAVAACRFARLREIERRHGGEHGEDDEARFFRSGVVGGWREPSVAEELAAFVAESREALLRLGYAS